MGFLDKVKFWKRDDDFGMPSGNDRSYDLGANHGDMQQTDPLAGSIGMQQSPLSAQDPFALSSQNTMQNPLAASSFPQSGQNYAQNYTQDGSMHTQQQQAYPSPTPFPGSMQQQYPHDMHDVHEQPQMIPELAGASRIQQRDMELILTKLDMIKSELDAMHQRIRKLEQASDAEALANAAANAQAQKRYW